jgi:hypothetical protein
MKPATFKIAGLMAFKDAMSNAKLVLLEPNLGRSGPA